MWLFFVVYGLFKCSYRFMDPKNSHGVNLLCLYLFPSTCTHTYCWWVERFSIVFSVFPLADNFGYSFARCLIFSIWFIHPFPLSLHLVKKNDTFEQPVPDIGWRVER